jgi:SAM-dependent methyltransferase
VDELVVPRSLHRNAPAVDPSETVDGAQWLIRHMSEHIGVSDLGNLDVLDFGCGVRFTQTFVDRDVPIGHYVGVDVSRDVIDFLGANVSDPRLEHYHFDAYNELYNPTGTPLASLTVPEIEGRQFDLICLFSVFTHLAPDDYSAMLRLLRRFVKPDGFLFFTLFINEQTAGGFGYVDKLVAALGATQDPKVTAGIEAAVRAEPSIIDAQAASAPDFMDVDPKMPLKVALYKRGYALELMEGTGWEVLEVAPPDVHLQHHIVCRPAGAD